MKRPSKGASGACRCCSASRNHYTAHSYYTPAEKQRQTTSGVLRVHSHYEIRQGIEKGHQNLIPAAFLRVVRSHTGQSSQLFVYANGGGAQFLPNLAGVVVWHTGTRALMKQWTLFATCFGRPQAKCSVSFNKDANWTGSELMDRSDDRKLGLLRSGLSDLLGRRYFFGNIAQSKFPSKYLRG